MYGPDVTILLMYGSHDMRHTGFRRLTVVNRTPRFGASQPGWDASQFGLLISQPDPQKYWK